MKGDAAASFDDSIIPSPERWSRRDLFASAFLFFATAGFVLWQNSQLAILWDLSYLLDTSWRIALGQIPYRDFPLVHAPLTFLIQAAMMRIAGRHYEVQIVYAAVVGGLGTVLSWRILFHALRVRLALASWAWIVSLLLAAPLIVLGVYSVYFHPIYDCDAVFAILVAIYALQRIDADSPRRFWVRPFIAGVLSVVPMFFKQNIGLPFLIAVAGSVLLMLAIRAVQKRRGAAVSLLITLGGMVTAMVVALVLIQSLAGLDNYLRWTVHFAASRRLPGISEMLSVYRQPSFMWTLPCAGGGLLLIALRKHWSDIAGVCLLSTPFVASLVYLFLNDDLDERADNLLALWPMVLLVCVTVAIFELRKGIALRRLTPFAMLAAIHGTFLSQQLWGSTYAIWPLLMILIAYSTAAIPRERRWVVMTLGTVVSATFLICGGLYAAGHERMNYLRPAEGASYRSTLPALHGMTDSGTALPDLEDLVRFADADIPPGDALLLLPGEDPFYFATGRTPQFPVLLFDRTADPYSPAELMAEVTRRNVRWVIAKTRLQSDEDPLPEREATMALVKAEFAPFRELSGYEIYRRR